MRFILSLSTLRPSQCLIQNYHLGLSAAINKIIQLEAVKQEHPLTENALKYFTFSDLRAPFYLNENHKIMAGNTAFLTVCFYIPGATENLIKNLFIHQQIHIEKAKRKMTFFVDKITFEKIPDLLVNKSILLQPISPIVTGCKNKHDKYNYLSPEDYKFADSVTENLLDKFAAINILTQEGLSELRKKVMIKPVFHLKPARGRLVNIKHGPCAKIMGYDKFRLSIHAPAPVIEMALFTGIGLYNTLGLGCVEIC